MSNKNDRDLYWYYTTEVVPNSIKEKKVRKSNKKNNTHTSTKSARSWWDYKPSKKELKTSSSRMRKIWNSFINAKE
jgi:hypothetical protein